MIIQPVDKTLIKIYQCGICKKIYLESKLKERCLVYHSPGTCCHFGDKHITTDIILEIEKILDKSEIIYRESK